MTTENNDNQDPIINDPFKDKRETYYSAMVLPYDSENFVFAYEKSLRKLSKKLDIHKDILKASLHLSRKLHIEGNVNWGVYNHKYSSIIIGSQEYLEGQFEEAERLFYQFAKKYMN